MKKLKKITWNFEKMWKKTFLISTFSSKKRAETIYLIMKTFQKVEILIKNTKKLWILHFENMILSRK